jgi:nitrite reductase/ring-hydroxylating ferredoxin subunit
MSLVKVESKLSPGEKTRVKTKDGEILVVNLDGKYYALSNKCTHMGCRLSDGNIKGENIQCPCHGSVFEIKTGKVVNGPAKDPEIPFKVKAKGIDVLIDV